jgi:hypothetical protein
MDIYAIVCIFTLVALAIWHAIIGANIFLNEQRHDFSAIIWFISLDRVVFFITFSFFIILHIALIIWLYMVPFKHRKNMAKKDMQYKLSINREKNKNNRLSTNSLRKSSSNSCIPLHT